MTFFPSQRSMRQQPQSPPPPYAPPKPFPSHYLVNCLFNYTYVYIKRQKYLNLEDECSQGLHYSFSLFPLCIEAQPSYF
jgi:hypothetical protein